MRRSYQDVSNNAREPLAPGLVSPVYRDSRGLEVDAIVEVADGRWAAFEVKLGSGQVDEAAASLHRFAAQIDSSGAPAVLSVIVATGYSYVRDDGIAVIPIGALGP
jgi:uncharacterized protein